MKTQIHRCGVGVDSEFDAYFERRVSFALGKFNLRITRIELFLNDENGPRGGLDKSCRLVVRMARHEELTVRDSDTEWSNLVDRAVDRMARLIRRTLDRDRRIQKTPAITGE